MAIPDSSLYPLIVFIILIVIFELINGFHDTANAVATVIYTQTLKPVQAVVWSGIWNFLGIYIGGIAVASSIMSLLPLSQLALQPEQITMSIILAILLSAIIWNFITWFFSLPCSSSHTLIGAMLGAGSAYWYLYGGAGINFRKAYDIGLSLLLSPTFGFTLVIIILFIFQVVVKKKKLLNHAPINKNEKPPFYIRMTLVSTCTLVSFLHGSNDGQKGIGLIMTLLILVAPMQFTVNETLSKSTIEQTLNDIQSNLMSSQNNSIYTGELELKAKSIEALKYSFLNENKTLTEKISLRKRFQLLKKDLTVIVNDHQIITQRVTRRALKNEIRVVDAYTNYAPKWALLLVALSLGTGTMIGWKRIVITIGEKIGKTHLTYAQGAASELVAATTIGLSTGFGLPVSTTHVLSSAVAGSMVAKQGVKNLQKKTVINIALAWVLTLPVTMGMAVILFLIFNYII
ncbi:MAG: inorganic phosphate transporter, partial [Flavobacteriaceae bacterium]|nr:inorganic phosphate transporter [Flavobacteriaceae bacterium]